MKCPDGYVILMRPDRKATRVDLEKVELVKCRNCRYLRHIDIGNRSYCCIHGNETDEDDWCSWAEKKETGDD